MRSRLNGVSNANLIEPEGTFLLWLDFRQLGLEPVALTAFLRDDAGWAVTRGQAFGTEGQGFARLNIACTHSHLDAALTRLLTALSNYR